MNPFAVGHLSVPRVSAWRWSGPDDVRPIVVASAAGYDDGLRVGYKVQGPERAERPDWLDDVATVHYDYFSSNGDGWYEKVAAVGSLVGPADRHKVVFTLHGWYDRIGRYAFDRAIPEIG